jgi:hypothetical protein
MGIVVGAMPKIGLPLGCDCALACDAARVVAAAAVASTSRRLMGGMWVRPCCDTWILSFGAARALLPRHRRFDEGLRVGTVPGGGAEEATDFATVAADEDGGGEADGFEV